jgi:hypothetical protein
MTLETFLDAITPFLIVSMAFMARYARKQLHTETSQQVAEVHVLVNGRLQSLESRLEQVTKERDELRQNPGGETAP